MIFVQNLSKDKDNPDYSHVGQKRLNPLDAGLAWTWHHKEFSFDLSEVSFTRGRKKFIFKEFDSGKTVLQWGKTGEALPPDGVKQKNKERLVDKAMQVNPHDYGLAFVIIAAIAGLAGGAIIMVVAYPSIFPEMMKKTAVATAKLAMMLWH